MDRGVDSGNQHRDRFEQQDQGAWGHGKNLSLQDSMINQWANNSHTKPAFAASDPIGYFGPQIHDLRLDR